MSATASAPAASSRPLSAPRVETVALCALTAVAAALRCTSLSRSLFTDEAYSLALAQRGFGHMLALFGYESNGTPYALALWPTIRIFGDGEAVLRAPALLAGVASVPALWWSVRGRVGPIVALTAAALLALNPMAIFYSQQARAYSMTMLAGILAFGALARALDGRSERRVWVGYVAAMAALAYCDLLAAPIVLPAQALMARRAGAANRRRWLWSLVAVAACCLPLLVAAAIERSRRNALYWLPRPDRSLVVLTVQEFSAGFSGSTAVRWLVLAAAAALVAGALVLARRRRGGEGTLPFALAWGLGPPAILLAASFLTPVFYPRYAIVALAGLCLLLAVSADRLASVGRSASVLAVCGVAVVATGFVAADVAQRNALQEDWPPAARWLAQRTPGQPVLVDAATVLPTLGYYAPAFRAPDGDLIVQEWHDRPLPEGFVGFKDPGGYGSVPAGQPSASDFAAAARAAGGSAWLLLSEVDRSLQGDARVGPAATWARAHCRVVVHESTGVWLLRASGCR